MRRTVDMIEADIPPEIEVLYPFWRNGVTEPGIYEHGKGCRLKDDVIWGWVPHPDLRKGMHTKAWQRARRRFLSTLFRPKGRLAFRRDVAPIRLWTGRRYRWFWVEAPKRDKQGCKG